MFASENKFNENITKSYYNFFNVCEEKSIIKEIEDKTAIRFLFDGYEFNILSKEMELLEKPKVKAKEIKEKVEYGVWREYNTNYVYNKSYKKPKTDLHYIAKKDDFSKLLNIVAKDMLRYEGYVDLNMLKKELKEQLKFVREDLITAEEFCEIYPIKETNKSLINLISLPIKSKSIKNIGSYVNDAKEIDKLKEFNIREPTEYDKYVEYLSG